MTGDALPHSTVFTGSRGLGKTVLLNVVRQAAQDSNFATAHVALDRTEDGVRRVAQALGESLAGLQGPKSLWSRLAERLNQFSLEISAAGIIKASGVWEAKDEPVAREHLRGLLVDAARLAASDQKDGLVLTLDELQECPPQQLAAVTNAIQDTANSHAPIAVFGAGLVQTPDVIMSAASFTERLRFVELRQLDNDSALIALVAPAENHQIGWSSDAAHLILDEAAGNPYLIQLLANETWMVARPTGPHQLSIDEARAGVEESTKVLRAGMFRGRWNRASAQEQQILLAVAHLLNSDGIATMSEVAEALDRTTSQLSTARRRLIEKGILESPARNQIAFTMPAFERFVLRHDDEMALESRQLPSQLER